MKLEGETTVEQRYEVLWEALNSLCPGLPVAFLERARNRLSTRDYCIWLKRLGDSCYNSVEQFGYGQLLEER